MCIRGSALSKSLVFLGPLAVASVFVQWSWLSLFTLLRTCDATSEVSRASKKRSRYLLWVCLGLLEGYRVLGGNSFLNGRNDRCKCFFLGDERGEFWPVHPALRFFMQLKPSFTGVRCCHIRIEGRFNRFQVSNRSNRTIRVDKVRNLFTCCFDSQERYPRIPVLRLIEYDLLLVSHREVERQVETQEMIRETKISRNSSGDPRNQSKKKSWKEPRGGSRGDLREESEGRPRNESRDESGFAVGPSRERD